MIEWIKQIDYSLFLAINGAHNNFFDVVMIWVSTIKLWIPLYILLLYLTIIKYKKKALAAIPVFFITVAISDLTSVHLFKNVFERLRPCYEPELAGLVNNIVGCGGQFGFVSSHASNSFAIAFMAIFLLGDKYKLLKLLMPLWAILIIYSRVYLGKHYPTDVIVGALVGILISWLMYKVFRVLIDHFSSKLT